MKAVQITMLDEYDRYIPKGFDWHEASRLVSQDQDVAGIWFHPRPPGRRDDEGVGKEAEGK